jgi:hypothetical protein
VGPDAQARMVSTPNRVLIAGLQTRSADLATSQCSAETFRGVFDNHSCIAMVACQICKINGAVGGGYSDGKVA